MDTKRLPRDRPTPACEVGRVKRTTPATRFIRAFRFLYAPRRWFLALVVLTLCVISLIMHYKSSSLQLHTEWFLETLRELIAPEIRVLGFQKDAYVLDTPGCRIPNMGVINSEVESYLRDFPTQKCGDLRPLVESNDTAVFVRHGVISDYNTTLDQLHCCYRAMYTFVPNFSGPIWDAEEGSGVGTGPLFDSVIHGNDIRYAGTCVTINGSAQVPHEFIRVECSAGGKVIYQDMHGFVPPKRPRGYRGNQTALDDNSLNVIIVGVDSVSRLNFLRKMPRTADFLSKTLLAVDMLAYNKVGDNTFPNLVPLLSGLDVSQLKQTCWPNRQAHFDACPWIWKTFNEHGYVNAFVEDMAEQGLFYFLKKGFLQQPTEYDSRTMLYPGVKELSGGFRLCVGQRLQMTVLFDYCRKIVRAMKSRQQKLFGLFWGASVTHDYLNAADEVDDMYTQFLADLKQTGILNKSVLIFASDHGLRFGPFVATYQGYLEERLPTMYIVLPEWFQSRFPKAVENLKINRRRLTTMFDLHQTLHDFMSLRRINDLNILRRVEELSRVITIPRGISLFTPIPAQRTCAEAGIPLHYCACQYMNKLHKDDAAALRVARFVVDAVNSALIRYTEQCASLSVLDVDDVWRGEPHAVKHNFGEHVYRVTLRTQPGLAMLSATVRHMLKSGRMWLAGPVTRLNAYGKQGWCVPDNGLRLYCYCRT